MCQRQYADSAFNGEGARRFGGRWNRKGQAAIYTAATLSLAALEILVHVDTDLIPNDYSALGVEWPDDLSMTTIQTGDLPADWQQEYPPLACQQLGADWLAENHSAILKVPSAIIPHEHNYILNPAHADYNRLKIHPLHFRFFY